MMATGGIRIESVSLGKGFVSWRVRYPPMARHKRGVRDEYEHLKDACLALKQNCRKEECDPETVALVEQHTSGVAWKSA